MRLLRHSTDWRDAGWRRAWPGTDWMTTTAIPTSGRGCNGGNRTWTIATPTMRPASRSSPRPLRSGGGTPAPQPIRRGDKGVLLDADKAAIIFNETRSLSGPNLQKAREFLAHAITNADERWGADRYKYAGSAPATIPGGVPNAEVDAYRSALDAVAAAKAQRAQGIDPTNGALNFNFRKPNQSGDFAGRSVKTRLGPFNNSYPTKQLPGSGVYSFTY